MEKYNTCDNGLSFSVWYVNIHYVYVRRLIIQEGKRESNDYYDCI